MATARRWKWAALGPTVALAAASTGCRWIPVRQGESKHESAPPMVGRAGSAADGDDVASSALPPLPPLRSVDDDEAFRPSRPTPLLDAAAERDDALKKALAVELASRDAAPKNRVELIEIRTPPVAAEPAPKAEDGAETAAVPKSDAEVAPAAFEPPQPIEAPPPTPAETAPEVCPPIVEPPDRVEANESTLWDSVLSAIATAESGAIAEPSALPATLVVMPPTTEFTIADLRLCRRVVGFGRTEPLAASACKPGQSVLLYCELDGLKDEETPDGFRSCLSSSVSILPAAGGAPVWSEDLGKAEDVCRRRRRDFFVNYRLNLPDSLPPGAYEVRLIQRDLLGDREASRSVPLTVRR